MGDPTTDGAVVVDGSPNVIIGGGSTATPSHPSPCLRAGIASGVPFLSGS